MPNHMGHLPDVRYRIPRTLAHVQIVKHRDDIRVVRWPFCVGQTPNLPSVGGALPSIIGVVHTVRYAWR